MLLALGVTRLLSLPGFRLLASSQNAVALLPSRRLRTRTFATWPTVVSADESFYFKPEAGTLLGSPANVDPNRTP